MTTDLAPRDIFNIPGCRFSPTGLVIERGLELDQWARLGAMLREVERAAQWWIGDWLLYGEREYGERCYQAIEEETGYDHETVKVAAWVSSKFPPVARATEVSFGHHKTVAGLEDSEARDWLKTASEKNLSIKDLREEIRNHRTRKLFTGTSDTCTVADLESLISNGQKFRTIYADPPWKYGNQSTRAATDNHYNTLTVQEIAGLPINDLAADNCHLHLWTTNAFLFDCKQIMEAWGFEYKSTFVWVKPQMGIGNYWRVSHEFLLLGVKGSQVFLDHSQMSWGQFDRTGHSAKPEQVRKAIERVSAGPRLELFGRHITEGWVVWGNEIDRTMFDSDVKKSGEVEWPINPMPTGSGPLLEVATAG